MTPTAVHADGEVHDTDISSLGPGVGVGVTVHRGTAAQLALTTPSASAAHAPATPLQRTRADGRHEGPIRTTAITPRTARAVNARRRDTSTTMSPRPPTH